VLQTSSYSTLILHVFVHCIIIYVPTIVCYEENAYFVLYVLSYLYQSLHGITYYCSYTME
jgi:hypothetical protein